MFQLKILIALFFLFPAFGEKKSSDVVIVNTNTNTNKATVQAPSQTVVAPALNPSKAKKLRNAREDAEVQTESLLLEKVEEERLKSEQKLLNKYSAPLNNPPVQVLSLLRLQLLPLTPRLGWTESIFPREWETFGFIEKPMWNPLAPLPVSPPVFCPSEAPPKNTFCLISASPTPDIIWIQFTRNSITIPVIAGALIIPWPL